MPIIKWRYIIKKLFIICALVIAPALYAGDDANTSVEFDFHNFPWGTSMEKFTAKMGKPAYVEEYDGLQSLVYDDIEVLGYPVFMLVYFSGSGLEGGTYYFHTFSLDELMQCYKDVQKELLKQYGNTVLREGIIREMRPYETVWDLPGGYVYLKVNTRQNEPVMLWYSSPALTKKIMRS